MATNRPAAADPMMVIDRFDGAHRWLSNDSLVPVDFDGVTYPTVEHAFAAAKTLDPAGRASIAAADSPSAAKKLGRVVQLRSGWDESIRYQVMGALLAAKFADPRLPALLTGTGDDLLLESNTWHDQHWGTCRCPAHAESPGSNHLGLALMRLRARLRGDQPDRWARVGFTGHRDLGGPDAQAWVEHELARVLGKLRDRHGARVLLNGMAWGADVLAAEQALRVGLDVWAYQPFADQTAAWASRDWVRRHEQVRTRCRRVVVLGGAKQVAGDRKRALRLLFGRNTLIVRDSDVLVAVHDRNCTSGGTAETVAQARRVGRTVIRIDPLARRVGLVRRP